MSLGEFTKQEANAVKQAVEDMFKALSKKKRIEYIGHLNETFLFIEAAKKVAPEAKNETA